MSYNNFEDYLNRNYKPYGCDDNNYYKDCGPSCNSCPPSHSGDCNTFGKLFNCSCNPYYLIITIIAAIFIAKCLGPHQRHTYGYLLIIAGYTFLLLSCY